MNRRLTLLLMVILWFSLDLTAQERLQDRSLKLCAVDLPVQQDKESPLVFKNMLFFSEPYHSSGNLEIINQGAKEIKYYLIVADILDRDGNYLLTVPILNEDRKRKIPFDVSFTSWLEASAVDYFEPIGAGEEANKPFFSQFGVIDCPASARISLLKLQYSDGTTFSAASPPIHVPPVLTDLVFDRPEGLETWRGSIINGTITIDGQGRASLKESDSVGPGFKEWLEHELLQWKFSPALINQHPRSVDLPFILFIDAPPREVLAVEALRHKGVRGPVLVIAAVGPEASFSGNWQIDCGKDQGRVLSEPKSK